MTTSLSPPPASVSSYLSPTIATIDLSTLAHNLTELRRNLDLSCTILAIVKADGYGHGSIMVTKALVKLGITKFGVSTIQEGAILREAGIQETIIIMGGILCSQIRDILHYQLTPVISDIGIAQQLVNELSPKQMPFPIHVKVDTGMKRLGFDPGSLSEFLTSDLFQGPLVLESLMTHLADADNPDPSFTIQQLTEFQAIARQLRQQEITIPFLHSANTAGIVSFPESHMDMVRPGLLLYGYAPSHSAMHNLSLKPVLSLSTKVVQTRTVAANKPLSYNGIYQTTRTSRIGVLPIGYAHGYNRLLSKHGYVLIGNARAPIVGRICMDMTLIDLTEIPKSQVGDDVILIGQQGTETISAIDLATWQHSVPYEVLCSIGPKVNRVYEPIM